MSGQNGDAASSRVALLSGVPSLTFTPATEEEAEVYLGPFGRWREEGTTSATLEAALAYAARGWPVFPAGGKRPLTAHGLKDATTERDRIAGWWRRWPHANVAIRTGAASRLIALDVDEPDGHETLRALERERGELPQTWSVKTPSGGSHFYFLHPQGGAIRNSSGALGPGLDVRADGGYVIAPPSAGYELDEETEVADPPPWLVRRERRNGTQRPASEWRELTRNGVAQGQRNESAAKLAGHLLARGVDPYVALELVAAWDATHNRPPLGRDEVARTVGSIAEREARKWMA